MDYFLTILGCFLIPLVVMSIVMSILLARDSTDVYNEHGCIQTVERVNHYWWTSTPREVIYTESGDC